jgi:hypothetical protein
MPLFPDMPIGEAIFLSRLPDGKAIGVRGIARQFTITQSMDYERFSMWDEVFHIPAEFRVDLNVDMLALQTLLVDLGEDFWTASPASPTPLPQPRLHD